MLGLTDPFSLGIPLRVVDSRGRVKVILFSSSSSDGDSDCDSKLLYHEERTRNVILYEKGSVSHSILKIRYTALICYEIAITIHWLRSSPSAATSHGDSTLSIRKNEAPVTFRLRTGRKHIRPYVVTCIHAFFDELSVGPLYCKVFRHYFKFHGRPSGQKDLSCEFFFHLHWSYSFYFLSILKCKIVHSAIALICTQNP